MKYRPELDGLRAIAVVGVTLFHLGINSVPGGFTGVDIFFVLSGYLITTIIYNKKLDGSFSFSDFYIRRARRILPALLFVIFAVIVFSFFILSPDHYGSLGRSGLFAVLSFSNFSFWMESGYFDASKYTKPLLHTWSLGVEEQFYLFWPALIMAASALKWRHAVIFCVTLTLLISILLMFRVQEFDMSAAFYLSPFRAWQFAAGAFLALSTGTQALNRRGKLLCSLRMLSTLSGLITIAWCFVFLTSDGYPGLKALVPTAGTLLLIAGNRNPISKFILANRPTVFLGKLSYSVYLWHWPVIVFVRYYINGPLSIPLIIFCILIVFPISFFSYRYVETPLRRPWGEFRDKLVVPVVLTSVVLFISFFSFDIWTTKGWKWRIPDRTRVELEQMRVTTELSCHKRDLAGLNDLCVFGDIHDYINPSIVIIGDSHSGRLALGLQAPLQQAHASGILLKINGVAPFLGVKTFIGEKMRKAPVDRSFEEIKSLDPDVIFVHARFESYWRTNLETDKGNPTRSIGIDHAPQSIQESQKNFLLGMNKTFDFLKTLRGHKVIVGAIPFPGVDLEQCLWRPSSFWRDEVRFKNCSGITRLDSIEGAEEVNSVLRKAAAAYGFDFVDPIPAFCNGTDEFCARIQNGKFLYSDDNHLNAAGGSILAEYVLTFMREHEKLTFLSKP